jgi:hypothetical protein
VSPADPAAGARFLAEIREQPAALLRLLEHEREYARVAAAARERGASVVRMAGHGSSDNAASYGVYAFGLLARWTALRDSITLTVHYGAGIPMVGSTAVALSQSGRTPDVVAYLERARERGAFAVALTNDPGSPLAAAADAVLPLGAGPELAVAATKTYLNQVAGLGLLAAHAAGEGRRFADGIRAVAEQLEAAIPELERRVPELAVPFSFTGRMFVIGRGVELGTAREVALKLLETCRVRRRGRVGARRRLRPRHSAPPVLAARAAPLGRPGPALRVGARARKGTRSRSPARAVEGHARSVARRELRFPPRLPAAPSERASAGNSAPNASGGSSSRSRTAAAVAGSVESSSPSACWDSVPCSASERSTV